MVDMANATTQLLKPSNRKDCVSPKEGNIACNWSKFQKRKKKKIRSTLTLPLKKT